MSSYRAPACRRSSRPSRRRDRLGSLPSPTVRCRPDRPIPKTSRTANQVAVTQQLARLEPNILARCTESVAELDSVCSFAALPPTDHLDLDWSPSLLREAVTLALLETWPATETVRLAGAMHVALHGLAEVNVDYRGELGGNPSMDVARSIGSATATAIARTLDRADADPLLWLASTAIPAPDLAFLPGMSPDGLSPEDVPGYLRQHWRALVDFYAGARARSLAVIVWLD